MAYLYLKHIQFTDLMLGHKKNQTSITYVPSLIVSK